jgi:hypothetical protein
MIDHPIDALLAPSERRADFIRAAIKAEMERRESDGRTHRL